MVRKEWKDRRIVEKVEYAREPRTEQEDQTMSTKIPQFPPHLSPLPVKVDNASTGDDIMDSLIETFAETKIEMVPRSVRLAKLKAREAADSAENLHMVL